MKLTYLGHSGFLLATDRCRVVIDYFCGAGKTIEETLASDKPLYVLVSHSHYDHYNPAVWQWHSRRAETHYIFSAELRSVVHAADVPVCFLQKGETYADDRIRVQAFGSTDIGASFLLSLDRKTIFHAGDLNNWHWRDESTDAEVRAAEVAYWRELHELHRSVDAMDVAMFPVDARMGSDYMRGAIQFVGFFSVALFIPMHFDEAKAEAAAFAAEAARHHTRFILPENIGDTFDI